MVSFKQRRLILNPMRSYEQIQAYQKRYRQKHREKLLKYFRARHLAKRKKAGNGREVNEVVIQDEVVERVLKSLPAPFGSFEKATYMIHKYESCQPFYQFVTTCHNTEECIEIMKEKYLQYSCRPKYCSIYKIQDGVKRLIFRDII